MNNMWKTDSSTSFVPKIYHKNDREVEVASIDRNKSINKTIQRLKNLTRDNTSAKSLIIISCKLGVLCKKVRQSQTANLHKHLNNLYLKVIGMTKKNVPFF